MRAALCFMLPLVFVSTALADPRDRFVEDGTFLVASVDIEQLVKPTNARQFLRALTAIQTAVGDDTLPPSDQLNIGYEYVMMELRKAGVERLFVAAAINDIRIDYAPLFVCRLEESRDPQGLIDLIERGKVVGAEVVDGQVWISTPKSLRRYRELSEAERPDLLQPLAAAGQGDPLLAVVVAPGTDARRVISELWPTLSGSLGVLTGPLIAEGLERFELTAHLGDPAGGRLAVVARDEASCGKFAEFAEAGLEQGTAWVRQNEPRYAELATQSAAILTPQNKGSTLSIELSADSSAVRELLSGVLVPAVREAQERSHRASKMNSMKQLALAMLNFENASGLYPGPIVDEGGKPLLSWRVAILPFLDQMALYDRLRLDEPWDSEHNLRVARALPAPFANPSHNELNARGLTTYLRPVYPGSDLAAAAGKNEPIASGKNGTKIFFAPGDPIRQITDGTSNTILIAEVAPEHAVFWTKPADWDVDLENPMAKLRTDKRDGFVTAWHDGHAKFLQFTMPADILRAVITKAGGEVVEYDGSW